MPNEPVRILLMEDDAGQARLFRKRMAQIGCRIDHAPDGEQGLARYDPEAYDLVVTDHAMPVYDGLEVIRRLAERGPLPPIIMVTGTGNERVAVEAMKLGARDYLVKDVDGGYLDLLPSVIERTLRQYHLEEQMRLVEEARLESERFLANIFDSIQDGISILDTDYNILRVNTSMERWFAAAMPLKGKKCCAAYRERNKPCEICPSRRTLETNQPAMEMIPLPGQAGGAPGCAEVYTFPLMDPASGKSKGVIQYIRNISQQKQTEEALCRSEENLRQSQKMEAVGRLAGGVAHDFNNILTAIIASCELLQANFQPTDWRSRDLDEIQKAAERAATLTRQLLAFSRKQIFAPKPCNLNDLVANLDQMLKRLIGEDVRLITIPGIRLGQVMADPGQIEQAIINLVVNARDSMPRGGVIVIETGHVFLDADCATHYEDLQPGDYITIAVSDNGAGIDPASLALVFEPFFTTKQLGQGTGLGLSMVHGIVKQSDGHITVDSEVGLGTTFTIYLPRLIRTAVEAGFLPPSCSLVRGTETILLVEDEGIVRRVARRILEMKGYTVLEAASGRDALLVSEQVQGPIQLMLTDVVMPGLSGKETADILKARRPELKVLYMSGHTEDAIVHHGVLDQGIAFIQKPFRQEQLAAKVREVLDSKPLLP